MCAYNIGELKVDKSAILSALLASFSARLQLNRIILKSLYRIV